MWLVAWHKVCRIYFMYHPNAIFAEMKSFYFTSAYIKYNFWRFFRYLVHFGSGWCFWDWLRCRSFQFHNFFRFFHHSFWHSQIGNAKFLIRVPFLVCFDRSKRIFLFTLPLPQSFNACHSAHWNELLGFKFRICFYIEIKIICTTRCQRQPHKRERNANSISTWASCLILVRFDFFFFYICRLVSVTTWRNLYTIYIWMATNIQVSRWEFDISTSKCRLDGAIMPHFLSHYLYWFWTKVSYIHIIINFTMLI